MGSISFQVVGDASVGTRTKTYSVSDANINRMVAWAQSELRQPGDPALTVAQALLAWAETMMNTTRREVVSYEQRTNNIAPFEAT